MERGLRRELCRVTAATLKIRGGVRSGLIRQESRKGCVDTMGVERDIGREPRSDAVRVAYAFTYRGRENGCNVEMQKELMYSLRDPSGGGGSQPYILCVGVDLYNQAMTGGVSKTLNNRATDADHVPCVLVLNDQGGA